MCGIVGYTGPREAGPILIAGLQRLEYRGYDSAGIALVDDAGELFVEKKAGKLANLQTAIADRTPHAAIGLAHTRWATHGRPNDLNAHPHQDCTGEITVIHNGIIENFRELRDGLEARGHRLTSETDTEALAHLIEEAYEGDLADAVRAALAQAEGAYAIAVMHRGEGDRLVGARQDVPLVVGLGEGEAFLASDVAAILAHTDRVIFLEEGDVADLRPWGVTDHRGRRRRPRAGRDGHRLVARGRREGRLRDVHAQGDPRAARVAPPGHRRPRHPHRPSSGCEELEGFEETLRRSTGSSSSPAARASYAALVGAAAIQDWVGHPGPGDGRLGVPLQPAADRRADARHRGHPVRRDGRHDRPDPPRPRAWLPRSSRSPTRSAAPSPARRTAVLFLQAGPEIAVAASKTFVTQVTTLVILAAAIAKIRGALGGRAGAGARGGAARPARRPPRGRSRSAAGVPELARRYVNSRGFMFVGRGYTYPTALEGALKLKEVSYVHAEGYAAGEMKHGPISLLDAECPLVAIATRSSVYEKLISNVMEGRARDARVIAVATEGDTAIERVADDVCWVPDTHEALSPVLAIIPLQLFAYHVAVARGTDVDQPRNLAKSVTVE